MLCLLLAAVSSVAGFDGPMPAPDATYEQLRADAGRDAEAQVKLALWCESHGLEKERLRHLAVATMADPSNALARGLMGLVEYNGKWKRPEAVARDLKADMARADLLAEYNGRRVKAAVTVTAQHKLALWCEEKGLKDEARAHLATVVRLDPNHADAWKRLGYKKVGNHWTTDAQSVAVKSEHTAQQEADKRWKSRLEHLRDALSHKGVKKDEAERELATLTDPRAVPMVWKVFVQGHEKHHLAAVQLLGQIDAIEASRALAWLALFDRDPEIRRRATETLRRRDPREWADRLIAMLRDPIKYEVRKVGGPGSPGSLYVEGKEVNVKRFYSPPSAPVFALGPNDTIETDAYGLPVIVRHNLVRTWQDTTLGTNLSTSSNLNQLIPDFPNVFAGTPLAHNSSAQSLIANANAGVQKERQDASKTLKQLTAGATAINHQEQYLDERVSIPIGQMMVQAQQVAVLAQKQLEDDIRQIVDLNSKIYDGNTRIAQVLNDATFAKLPAEKKAWTSWWANQLGVAYKLTTPDAATTVVENVPLNYQAQPVPISMSDVSMTSSSMIMLHHSCFAEGTLVRTLDGPRPIDKIQVGDRVLTQNIKNGRLGYQPVIVVFHNPPSPTFRVTLGDDAIVTSPSHRFWVASRGWVMARDLKVGDPIRTLGDVAKVTAIEPEKVQLVYNLDVADDADFFVGSVGALVHDNTLPDLRLAPFDAPSVAAVK
jgi:hypothetical protein